MIKKTYDPHADALYIKCRSGKAAKTEDKGDYMVDYDTRGEVLGYEVLNYSVVVKRLGAINGISLALSPKAVILTSD